MSEIKWIKITTTMFDDEKITFIESLPEADAILIVWIKLLTLAGKINAGGYIFLTENIPYTDEMLAHLFRRPLNTVRLALDTLKRLKMISMDGEMIKITNWGKHQNIEGMERVKLLTRERVAKHREKKKQEQLSMKRYGNVTVTLRNATDIDIDKDIDKENNNKYMCVDTHMPPSPTAPAECVSSSEKPKKRKKQEDYTEDFEEFWTNYPRKVEKKTAYKAWNTRIRDGTSPEDMIKAAKNYAKYCQLNGTEDRFIKHPSTFIGQNEPYKEYVNFSPNLPQRSSQTSEDRIADIQRKIAQANREAVEMWDGKHESL